MPEMNKTETQGLNPLGNRSCGEDRGRAQSPTLSTGSMSSAIPPQAQQVEPPSSPTKSQSSTILFDLNAAPELEEGEVQQDISPCELSLSLAIRPETDPAPNPIQNPSGTGEGAISEGITHYPRKPTTDKQQQGTVLQISSDPSSPLGGV